MKEHNHHLHKPICGDTYSLGCGLSIYAKDSINKTITVTNNKAHYFANLAKKYRDEAKIHCENAKNYAESSSNVTYDQLIDLRVVLETEINGKQDIGDYALKGELPVNISELNNDSGYVTDDTLEENMESVRLPEQVNNGGKILSTDGENSVWVDMPSELMFTLKHFDHQLSFEDSVGLCLLGSYVYKNAISSTRYGYPDFYNKCIAEKNVGTQQTITVGSYSFTGYINANGHVFYNIADKSIIDNIYNSTGMAWYYGVDTENERIFLPRAKSSLLRGNLASTAPVNIYGNGKPLLLKTYEGDGSGTYFLSSYSDGCEIHSNTLGSNIPLLPQNIGNNVARPTHGAVMGLSEWESGITGTANLNNLETVVDIYVYMVVGHTSTTNSVTIEMTLDAAEAPLSFDSETGAVKLSKNQTLEVDTNGNLGINKKLISGIGMPSGRIVNISNSPASGSLWTAPANGYFCVNSYASEYIGLLSSGLCIYSDRVNSNIDIKMFIPVKKGNTCTVVYSPRWSPHSWQAGENFYFVYADGES